MDTVVVGGMHEVQDYITLTNHTLYTNMMVMSESYFNSFLPPIRRSLKTPSLKQLLR